MSAEAPLFIAREVTKRYAPGAPAVLERLSFSLARGEYVAIMGESGVGKSTLLQLIAGLDRPDAGSLRFEGIELTSLDDDRLTSLRRTRMGFVFQAFHLLPYLTVLQNAALPLDLMRVADPERTARTCEVLAQVGLKGRERDFPRALSGGEMQRLSIARALVHRPALILADEPTGNLDPKSARAILELLRAQMNDGLRSGILITHSQAAARTADRIFFLDGRELKPCNEASM